MGSGHDRHRTATDPTTRGGRTGSRSFPAVITLRRSVGVVIGARQFRGRVAQRRGMDAEHRACAALQQDGWTVLARRLRTQSGEIDIVAERSGLLALVEVKARKTLAIAAGALQPRQRTRLLAAAQIVLAEHPDWGRAGMRFDVVVVADSGEVRRITDAFRQDDL